jgi:hypothetical protein
LSHKLAPAAPPSGCSAAPACCSLLLLLLLLLLSGAAAGARLATAVLKGEQCSAGSWTTHAADACSCAALNRSRRWVVPPAATQLLAAPCPASCSSTTDACK